jgi:alpha-D-xyloside xylohydrolase
MFENAKTKLIFRYDAEKLWIEPWGSNSLRVRATRESQMPSEDWALLSSSSSDAEIKISDNVASITNGDLTANITMRGKLTMYNSDGKLLLEEFVRNRVDPVDPKCSALMVDAREFKAIPGGDYHVTARFEALDEKLYGMGQYQQENWDLKGCDIELAHRNSQVCNLSSL